MEKKTNTLKKALTGIILSVILIVIDQVTKLMAIHGLMNQQPFVIWDGVFELHYLENRGAAFGILQGKKIFFVIFTLVVLCMIAYLYLKRIPDEKKFRPIDGICILFFAGALGNFIDRVFRNYVVDFFYFKLIDFPVFNVADIYVTVAATEKNTYHFPDGFFIFKFATNKNPITPYRITNISFILRIRKGIL